MKLALTLTALLLLSGCGDRKRETEGNVTTGAAADATAAPDGGISNVGLAAPSPTVSGAVPVSRARYLGRWRGVEGLNLVVAPRSGEGDAVSLAMQWSLDDKGTYDGEVTPEGIAFERAGVRELLRPSDGATTGLKYLDGKKDCLTVEPGEGYCRD
ncbi:hypothetical protein K7957_13755 [Sphingomonas yunnanensis]|uniref:hypothetical protein n=1 Tax=Sphingomonas yunnanensis TaxID=310400 RepID=UPI001CA7546C|nr:hypothetical protein [Sphingomonas yunnanensis]MBY9064005.1 hypothetical protein [Sphingomonas yunnanensis]